MTMRVLMSRPLPPLCQVGQNTRKWPPAPGEAIAGMPLTRLMQETLQDHRPQDGRPQLCPSARVWQEAAVRPLQGHRDGQRQEGNAKGNGEC